MPNVSYLFNPTAFSNNLNDNQIWNWDKIWLAKSNLPADETQCDLNIAFADVPSLRGRGGRLRPGARGRRPWRARLDRVRDGADHENPELRQQLPRPGAARGEGEARPQAGRHPLLRQGEFCLNFKENEIVKNASF